MRQRRGGGQEPRIAAHDDADINARQRPVVEVDPHEGLDDETRRRGKTRRVVIDGQVVVDGLGNMDAAERIAGGPSAASEMMRTVSALSLPPI